MQGCGDAVYKRREAGTWSLEQPIIALSIMYKCQEVAQKHH